MAEGMVKCPHCFGEKPAEAKVCFHCGRDREGFGPIVCSSGNLVSRRMEESRPPNTVDFRFHMMCALAATLVGLLIMLSTGLGTILFILGIAWLLAIKIRIWWRRQGRYLFR